MTASEERLSITYSLICQGGEAAFALARRIAFGVIGGLPGSELGTAPGERLAGRVEEIERLDSSRWVAVVSFSAELIGDDAAQLVRLASGDFLPAAAEVCGVHWPAALLRSFGGPRVGVEGLGGRLPASAGAVLAARFLGPLGSSAEQLAARAAHLVEMGADLVIDHPSLTDQRWAPLAARAERCLAAVAEAGESRGRAALFAANLTGPAADLERRVDCLRQAGVEAALVVPFLAGAEILQRLAGGSGLLLVAPVAPAGRSSSPRGSLDGELLRLLGADVVLLPARHNESPDDVARRPPAHLLQRPLGGLRASALAQDVRLEVAAASEERSCGSQAGEPASRSESGR